MQVRNFITLVEWYKLPHRLGWMGSYNVMENLSLAAFPLFWNFSVASQQEVVPAVANKNSGSETDLMHGADHAYLACLYLVMALRMICVLSRCIRNWWSYVCKIQVVRFLQWWCWFCSGIWHVTRWLDQHFWCNIRIQLLSNAASYPGKHNSSLDSAHSVQKSRTSSVVSSLA